MNGRNPDSTENKRGRQDGVYTLLQNAVGFWNPSPGKAPLPATFAIVLDGPAARPADASRRKKLCNFQPVSSPYSAPDRARGLHLWSVRKAEQAAPAGGWGSQQVDFPGFRAGEKRENRKV